MNKNHNDVNDILDDEYNSNDISKPFLNSPIINKEENI